MASTYLSRTPSSAGNSKTFTFSAWVKLSKADSTPRAIFGSGSASNYGWDIFHNGTTNGFMLELYDNGGVDTANLRTTAVLRDLSAWYHFVVAVDTTQATASDRYKIYINGNLQTSFNITSYPTLNYDMPINTTNDVMYVGNGRVYNGYYFDGYMSHVHFTDGTAYDATAFGEYSATSGVWKPKTAPSVTYGTNGFFLKFANSAALGTDSSVNGNDFTVNGTGTQTLDTPSNVFCTMNPLDNYYFNGTFVNGNTTTTTGTSQYTWCTSTLGVSSGKWYWEVEYDAKSGGSDVAYIGITPSTSTSTTEQPLMSNNQYYYYSSGSGEGVTMGDSYTTGDIIGIALDLDNNKIYFSKNGVWQNSGDPTSGATGTGAISITDPSSTVLGNYFAIVADGSSSYNATFKANFGNGYFGTTAVSTPGSDGAGLGKFEYAVPTGYYSLCTKNIITYG